jgi:hypothetical protein
MVIEEVTFKTARPEQGMVLLKYGSNGEPMIARNQVLNSQGNWEEVTIEEGDAIMAQWRAEQENRMQAEMNDATR